MAADIDIEKITTDQDEIKRWAGKYKAKPELIDMPEGRAHPVGLRLDFPGPEDDAFLSDTQVTPEISWDEFFNQFEAQGLAFVYYDPHPPDLPPEDGYRFIKRTEISS